MARRSPFADKWPLDPAITFLNHGSFGACPTAVLASQRAWQDRMEGEPVRWFADELEPAQDDARRRVGAFLNADPDDLAFVANATAGVNTVLRSLHFKPGDRILAADHEYNAILNAAAFVAARDGATLDIAALPFPVDGPEAIIEGVLDAVRPRTRLVVLSAITSPTAVVMPIVDLVHALTDRGIEVLVDGAHAPGQVPVDIGALEAAGVSYWTGNAHKWLCAPKGSGILWVRRDRQPGIRPLVISHGANAERADRSRFRLEFDWQGTDDWSAPLSIPAAIDVLAGWVPDGWREIMARNHALAIGGRDLVCDRLGLEPATPDGMVGAMAAIPLPVDPAASESHSPLDIDPLQAALMERHRIQVPIGPWPTAWTPGRDASAPSGRLLRLSAQLYNSLSDYEQLAEGLAELLPRR
ncbi:MAG TPA: aminotransferase class V-fold PLP-dependent enzyme [Candidatus Limnocylindrales bacterium]|jgi:isopenicillin-N epimerase